MTTLINVFWERHFETMQIILKFCLLIFSIHWWILLEEIITVWWQSKGDFLIPSFLLQLSIVVLLKGRLIPLLSIYLFNHLFLPVDS